MYVQMYPMQGGLKCTKIMYNAQVTTDKESYEIFRASMYPENILVHAMIAKWTSWIIEKDFFVLCD